jgi:hypothetical protein
MDADLAFIAASPTYADDSTVYVAENGTSRIWKSTDGGERWVGLASPDSILAFALVDADTYFTGHDTEIYKSGRWNYGTITDGAKSIAVSPNFADDDTVLVGTVDGAVYISTNASATTGVKYTLVGADNSFNDNNVVIAFDPGYTDSNIIYAGCEGDTTATSAGVFRWDFDTSVSWLEIDDGAGTDDLDVTGLVITDEGVLYASSTHDDEMGVRRELGPDGPTARMAFESLTASIPGGSELESLDVITGSDVLYSISAGNDGVFGTYEYDFRVITFTDTMAIAPTITAPGADAEVGTTVTLSWEALDSPTTPTYVYNIATDSAFANKVNLGGPTVATDGETTGTAVIVSGLTAGQKYYWRVYVKAATPVLSRKASSTFICRLGATTQSSTLSAPAPGATGIMLQPTFQWSPVTGASSYVLEVADNANFVSPVSRTLSVTVFEYPEALEYSTTYYWRVKAIGTDAESAWSNGVFTTMAKPVAPPAPPAPAPAPAPAPTPAPEIIQQPIPSYLLWTITGIGAILIIALIVLIVRTRRVV